MFKNLLISMLLLAPVGAHADDDPADTMKAAAEEARTALVEAKTKAEEALNQLRVDCGAARIKYETAVRDERKLAEVPKLDEAQLDLDLTGLPLDVRTKLEAAQKKLAAAQKTHRDTVDADTSRVTKDQHDAKADAVRLAGDLNAAQQVVDRVTAEIAKLDAYEADLREARRGEGHRMVIPGSIETYARSGAIDRPRPVLEDAVELPPEFHGCYPDEAKSPTNMAGAASATL